jgi:hypothetical protein
MKSVNPPQSQIDSTKDGNLAQRGRKFGTSERVAPGATPSRPGPRPRSVWKLQWLSALSLAGCTNPLPGVCFCLMQALESTTTFCDDRDP